LLSRFRELVFNKNNKGMMTHEPRRDPVLVFRTGISVINGILFINAPVIEA